LQSISSCVQLASPSSFFSSLPSPMLAQNQDAIGPVARQLSQIWLCTAVGMDSRSWLIALPAQILNCSERWSCFWPSGRKTLCCKDDLAEKINRQFNLCEWRGTAPVCSKPFTHKECRPTYTEIFYTDDSQANSNYNPSPFIFPRFGFSCVTGSKTLCCKHVEDPEWANVS
ncbi:hypothetical protein PENTCL1PPCAC_18565, partial [Pristionchus entomophagus]